MLVHRLAEAEISYMLSLLRPLQKIYGEESGIAVARYGNSVGLSMAGNDDPLFNRVLGLTEEDLPLLEDILDWYVQRRLPCRFDVLADACRPNLWVALRERGFVPATIETFLHRSPGPSPVPVGRVEVRKLAPEQIEEFTSVFLAVYPFGPSVEPSVRTCLQAQYSQPEWRCYLASLEGTVAAFGAMYMSGGVAALLSAATLPAFRRQGCQSALISQRLQDAAKLDCDLVLSHAACGSTSQHNMERLGLRPSHLKYRFSRPDL